MDRIISFQLLLAITLSSNSLAIESPQPQEAYQHARKISDDMYMFWNFTDETISFEVHGRTTGWVGIGFSSKGNMVGADIVVGWINANGNAIITDRYGPSTSNGFPPLDPEQNLISTSGREVDGWTIISFTRDRAACDDAHDKRLNDGTQKIIWAIGQSDPSGGTLSAEDRHTNANRGSISVYLFQDNNPIRVENFTGPSYDTFDITATNFALPNVKTYYNCRIVKIPTMTSKRHIVKIEPLIQQENIRNVHHMLIYMCPSLWTPDEIWQEGKDIKCGELGIPRRPCTSLIMGWAVGGHGTTFPEDTGIPIGDSGVGGSLYALLETHYDNPDAQEGIIDSSGMRFIHTGNLRKYDTGIFVVGQMVSGLHHYIPPGAENFTTKAPCISDCVNSALTSATVPNITVHHVIVHSHLAGRKMKLRHFRNGKELPHIIYDDAYDFNYQEYVGLDPFVTILPGDELQMECTYNTEGRDIVTLGGEGTEDEMCLAYISYYPAIPWRGCFSFTDANDSIRFFGVSNYEQNYNDAIWSLRGYNVSSPSSLSGKTLLDVVLEHNWIPEQIREFEKYFHEKPKTHICSGDGGWEATQTSIIETDSPYIPPTQTCGATVTTMNSKLIGVTFAIFGILKFI